jgi:hypothetical protein
VKGSSASEKTVGASGDSMAESRKDEPLEGIELLTDGVIYEGLAHKRGERMMVPKSTAAAFRQKGWAKPAAKVLCLQPNRLIGSTVGQPGYVLEAPTVDMALRLHEDGVALFLNASDCGTKLPSRKALPACPKGFMRALVTKGYFRHEGEGDGRRATEIPKGIVLMLDKMEAQATIADGFAVAFTDPMAPVPPPVFRYIVEKHLKVWANKYEPGDEFFSLDPEHHLAKGPEGVRWIRRDDRERESIGSETSREAKSA